MKNNLLTQCAVGIDLGGTFVKFALVSVSGDIIYKDKLPIGVHSERESILNTIRTGIEMTLDFASQKNVTISGIGIGSPGIIDQGVVIGGAENLAGWYNLNLADIISETFHLQVLVDNDANVMALGETIYGAARGCSDVIFITVGTGIGGAIMANGSLYRGYRNHGGELGHITINHDGIDCNCGGRGCLEAYASTSALIKQYAEMTGIDVNVVDGHYILEKFSKMEKEAVQCLQDHTGYLGHGIASLINVFAPQKVVIGGGISEAGQFYIDMIRKSAFKYAMPDSSACTEIVAAMLGNNAGCLGAASMVFIREGIGA